MDNVLPRALAWSNVTKFEKNDYNRLFGPGDSNPNLELYATPVENQTGWFIASNFVDLQHNSASVVSVFSPNSHKGLNETRVANNKMLLLEGGDGCFDSEGGATNPESNKDKPPTLVDVLDEVRALRKEVALSTCSSPDMDNGEVAVAGMDFTSMDGRMKSSNAMITLDVLIQVAYDGMGIDKEDGNNDYTDSQRETSTLDVLGTRIDSQEGTSGHSYDMKFHDEEDLSNKSKYVNVVKEDHKPCLGMVFANVKAKRKKCGIERKYVLRFVKERNKRLAMSLDSPFAQQATTTPALPKIISMSVNGDFIAPPEFLEDVVLGRSLNVDPINELMTLEVFVEVYFPVNEPKKHWCLAELHISTGVVTFYDSLGWVCGNRRPRWRTMKRTLPQQLTLYLNEHEVLQNKGIAVETYEIKYMFPKVVRQADDYGDCGVWLSIDGGSITSAPAIMTMPSHHFLKLLGFNNHDLPIVEAATGHIMGHTVQVYMENSQSFKNVAIQGNAGSFFVDPNKESLILAAYPNHSLYCVG
ncbi:phospholipase-like protein [Tanacetum coccineum]